MQAIVSLLLAYLLGSISSAIVICKLMRLPDPRQAGSGNPGATNVLRLSGKLPAVLTLIGDVAKGTLPVAAASALTHDPVVIGAAALGAFLGHLYPVFFGFAGGKGIATAIGAYLGLNPLLCAGVVAVWLAVAALSRYSSLSSLLAMMSAPVILWYLDVSYPLIAAGIVIFLFSVYRHKANIHRLIDGEESKIKLSNS